MDRQALVIGLGQFGMSLARSLTEVGVDVFAVDREPERVRVAAGFAADAAAFDATDEAALARVAPQRRDVSVCAIGDEAREAAIICSALLRQMGAPRVIARAGTDLVERILLMVGAHEVVNPERAYGQRLAVHIAHEGVLGEYPLSEGLAISELHVPAAFVGRSMAELQLPRRHGVTVVAIQRGTETVTAPDPQRPLASGDVLVVVAKTGAVANLMERLG